MNASSTIEKPASLRSEHHSPSARNAVRVPFGISVHLRWNPQWDLAREKLTQSIPLAPGASFGLSPDGLRYFLIRDDSASVRETLTGRLLLDSPVLKTTSLAAFSPDSQFLAAMNTDNQLMLWDLSKAATLVLSVALPTVSGGQNARPAIGFSQKNRTVAVTTGGVTQAYTYSTLDLVRELCSLIDRPLSTEEWKRYVPTEAFRNSCPAVLH